MVICVGWLATMLCTKFVTSLIAENSRNVSSNAGENAKYNKSKGLFEIFVSLISLVFIANNSIGNCIIRERDARDVVTGCFLDEFDFGHNP
jgi:hypothetical protein